MIFKAVRLKETITNIKNPDRGWYQIYPYRIGRGQKVEALENVMDASESLSLLLLDIGAYKDRPLDDAAKAEIRQVLDFFKGQKKDLIVRPTYDRQGKAIEAEPSFFFEVADHAGTLAKIFGDYDLFLMQGAGVGAWGELHDSRYTLDKEMAEVKQLLSIYQAAFRGNTYLSVRTPAQYRKLKMKHMGLFDDAILSSETDMGTFGQVKKRAEDDMGRRSRSREMRYINKLGKHFPVGGEVVWGPTYTKYYNNVDTINALKQMRITYLNSLYDRQLLDYWERKKTGFPGKWMLVSMYDYIGAHMGYRYVVTKVSNGGFFKKREDNNRIHLSVVIENKGFAPMYRGAEIYYRIGPVELEKKERLDFIMPGEKRAFHLDIKRSDLAGLTYAERKLYICARRKMDNAPIHFSNEVDETGELLLGIIN